MVLFAIIRFLLVLPVRLLFCLKVKGRDNIPKEGGVVISSTHIHLIDPVSHAICQKRPFRSMAKEELFKNKFFGAFLKSVGAFPVRRGRSDKGAVETGVELLKSGNMLIVYPEGHRSKNGIPLDFKPGVVLIAHLADVPIVPAVIIAKHGYRLFGGVIVKYGKPISLSELGIINADSKELRRAALALQDIAVEMLAEEAEEAKEA